MRKSLLSLALIAAALTAPIALRADTIDEFTFTSSSNTISFALPATTTFAVLPPPLVQAFSESAPTTIDGVSGYDVTGTYYLPPGYLGDSLYLDVPSSIFGSSPLGFSGPSFLDVSGQGSQITVAFLPGTYTLQSFSGSGLTSYTLNIEQEAAATTPEPSSLILVATGLACFIYFAGSRSTSRCRAGLFES